MRSSLLVDPFIDRLRELLHSKSIEVGLFLELPSVEKKTNLQVSYFAAGIVAHLASDRPELWTVAGTPKNVITTELWQVENRLIL